MNQELQQIAIEYPDFGKWLALSEQPTQLNKNVYEYVRYYETSLHEGRDDPYPEDLHNKLLAWLYKYAEWVICPTCHGKGETKWWIIRLSYNKCHGKGMVILL